MARSTVFSRSVEMGREACLGFPRRLPCWLPLRTALRRSSPGLCLRLAGLNWEGARSPRSLPAALKSDNTASLLRCSGCGAGWVGE